MIKSLRKKFIFIASGSIFIILSIVLVCVNAISYYSGYKESMSMLNFIADNNGRMPDEDPRSGDVDFFVSREFRFETRYFSAITDTDGNYIVSNAEHITASTQEEAEEMCSAIISGGKKQGRFKTSDSIFFYKVKNVSGKDLGGTLFQTGGLPDFLDEDTEYQIVLFMDCTNRFYRINSMRNLSLLIGVACFAVFIVLVSILSKRAVKPVAENYEKQKQFITNAGHELKTPLAIISANAEVMEAINGGNEWTQSTRHQVERLTGLVNDLITIAKLDEAAERQDVVMEAFDISEAMQKLSDDFKTVAYQQGKTLETNITPDIFVNGNKKMLCELISILLDNSVKYCDDGGSISSELKQQRNHVCLTVSNTYAEKADCTRFFDRFYREDTSHNSEKSGYGIGLSMAETIVKLHKGKITAKQMDKRVYFTVIFPISA